MENSAERPLFVPTFDTKRFAFGFLGLLGLAVAAVWSTWIAASTWKSVRGHGQESKLQVTGSAKKRIVSDTIEWSAVLSVTHMNRTVGYKADRKSVV